MESLFPIHEQLTPENLDKVLREMREDGTYDVVDNPKHYCSGAHECIDVMEELFGTQAVVDFCKCNIFKYRFRAAEKNGDEDIAKAEWYEDKLIELNKKLRGEFDDD